MDDQRANNSGRLIPERRTRCTGHLAAFASTVGEVWRLVVVVLVLSSCTSTGGTSDAWSRTYFAPRDEVIDAVIDVLEDEGYLVDANRETGRIMAEPSRDSGGNLASLVVKVTPKNERIRVDVQARTGASFSAAAPRPAESPILEFLHALDQKMRSGTG